MEINQSIFGLNSTQGLIFSRSSSHSNSDEEEEYIPYSSRPETYIVPAVFALIFLVGLIGNGTLIFIFIRKRSMRNIPNTYIISLSVGDFLVMTCTVPFISTIYTFESWPYGEFVCKASEFLRDVSIGVTVLTLTMLSVDRYVAIVLPIQKHTGQHAKTFTVVCAISIWLVSVVLASPGAYYSFIWEYPLENNKSINICYPFPESMMPWYPQTIVLLKFLLLYAIPLVTIATFYALMAKHLLHSSQNAVGKNDTHRKQLRARTKVAKIVLVFVVIFAICFFPNHLFMLWYYFHPDSRDHYNQFWHVWKIMGYVLTFGNSCLNPIALYTVSGVYRCYFRKYLFCCFFSKAKLQRSRYTIRNTSVRSSTRITYSATRI